MACINADSYRHFGRLGGGTVMGAKNLKAIVIHGDGVFPLPENKDYPDVFDELYQRLTATDMMSKYHNLGTPVNMAVLNEIKALPIRNLQVTSDPAIEGITGERFARDALLRNGACSGCPIGCIHIGFVREKFMEENRYLYRQVSYDHEPIFAEGAMLGVNDCFDFLLLLDMTEKMGLDVMSCGVSLAWATEATQKGIISEEETIVPLSFGDAAAYKEAVRHLALGTNEFYRFLGQGTMKAAERYGGADFGCVLGQEMGGYATGEVFFTSQALGFRHSHLDASGYSYDQKHKGKDVSKAADFLVEDERGRAFLTSTVACLFARSVYSDEVLAGCLDAVGYRNLAMNIQTVSSYIQKLRWKTRISTGYDPEAVQVPKRFTEVVTESGPVDRRYLEELKKVYADRIRRMADG